MKKNNTTSIVKIYSMPDKNGMYGEFGGRYVPKPLEEILKTLTRAYDELKS